MAARKGKRGAPPSSIRGVLDAVEAVAPKPPSTSKDQNEKRKYAQRLSDALAVLVADLIRQKHKRYASIKPDPSGKGKESRARTIKGFKKLDVNYSTPELGLALGVSIKTVNHGDVKNGRYDHNLSRHDTEFLAESSAYHQRQPYAVMVALFFMPADGCTDATARRASSFGRAVEWFHHRANRQRPDDDPNLFERVFVAFYEPEGAKRGEVRFFDVMEPPPWNGRPSEGKLLTLDGVIDAIVETFEKRNGLTFEWATGETTEEDEPEEEAGTDDYGEGEEE